MGERHPGSSPRRHAATADLIGETFHGAGLAVEEQSVTGPFGVRRNVIGRLRGVAQPERVWIVGAHYDTVRGSPGADDNGVAVAALPEAARQLSARRLRDTVELVAWDLEVQSLTAGYALGSRVMAREAVRAGRQLMGVFDLEMIGCCRTEANSQHFPPGFRLLFPKITRWVRERDRRGDFLAVVTDPRSLPLAEALSDAGGQLGLPLISIPVRAAARSERRRHSRPMPVPPRKLRPRNGDQRGGAVQDPAGRGLESTPRAPGQE